MEGSCWAQATEGHYVNGVEGIKAASLPPPGIYWRMYNVYYHADTLRDGDGDKADVGFDVKVFANVNRLIWMTKTEVLGGNFFMDGLVPVQYTDIKLDAFGVDDNKLAIGDPFVEPLGLSWHGKQYDAAVAGGAYLPVGDYDKDDAASPGKDMWTFMLTAGGTVYFDQEKTWAASILSRFETHSYKKDTDIRPGNDFHFEYGFSKTFMQTLDVGLAGYCQWQVSDDKGSDVVWDEGSHDRVVAAGPEVNYFIPKYLFFVSLRHELEFFAEDRPEGAVTTLTLTKGF
ncbi:MAG: hypothetical protein A2X46_05410 [Lentisphaerae bacterium GWF2_57_35]|nr:MAG: hypothetical protein A2X46_05410 [Lentisphaerae bacterium GWF2_57_35]